MVLNNIFTGISKIETRKFLFITFLSAFFIRVLIVFTLGNWTNPDLYEHGGLARNMLHGHGFSYHWPYISLDPERIALKQLPPKFYSAFIPPVNPYIIFLAFRTFGDTPVAHLCLLLFNCICSALCVPVVFKITELLKTGNLAPRLSAIATVFYIPGAFAVTTYSGSALYHLLVLLVMLSTLSLLKIPRAKKYILLGMLCGILTLTRSEFLLPAFVLILYSVLYPYFKDDSIQDLRKLLLYGSASMVICAGIIAPWTYRNFQLFGRFIPVVSHPWHEIWKGYNPYSLGGMNNTLGKGNWVHPVINKDLVMRLDALPYDQMFEIRADAEFKKDAINFIKKNPGRSIFLTFNKVFMLWVVDYTYPKALNPINVFFSLFAVIPIFIGIFSFSYKSKERHEYGQ
ncbi:MAG TPA: glycosyltransferase family 39 protein, partial [Patescibacteria group bacterium]|nr:glycosyltransferase family 39 protein [Patescibacteria group bacterium]